MLHARTAQAIVMAKDVTRSDEPFTCLECEAAVLLKKGQVKAHHFAHVVDTGCRRGCGEGERHSQLKAAICAALSIHPDVSDLQQERRTLKEVYPDVSFRLRQTQRVAIEVQVSPISISTIRRRVEAYTARGIALLWVLPADERLVDGARYRPTRWERYLHALYRRIVFYWTADQRLIPVSYQPTTITGDDFHWYEDKDAWTLAGQPRRSKRFSRLQFHPEMALTDLVAVTYPAWETAHVRLPEARLWTRKPARTSPSKRLAQEMQA